MKWTVAGKLNSLRAGWMSYNPLLHGTILNVKCNDNGLFLNSTEGIPLWWSNSSGADEVDLITTAVLKKPSKHAVPNN